MECFLNALPVLTSWDAVCRKEGKKSRELEGAEEGKMGKEGWPSRLWRLFGAVG